MFSTMMIPNVDVLFTCEPETIEHHLQTALNRLSTTISTYGINTFNYDLDRLVKLCRDWFDFDVDDNGETYAKNGWYPRISLLLVINGCYCELSAKIICHKLANDQFARWGDRRDTIFKWQYV